MSAFGGKADIGITAAPQTLFMSTRPSVDGIRALRRGLKYLLRGCGLRVVSLQEYPPGHAEPVRRSVGRYYGHRKDAADRKARCVSKADRSDGGIPLGSGYQPLSPGRTLALSLRDRPLI